MAEPAPISKEELSKKLVQEISLQRGHDQQIPERYIHKDGYPEAIDAPELWTDSLLIDFSLLSSSSPVGRHELVKLRSALSDWGCFHVINHGMESSFLEEVTQLCKEFFALPLEEKLKCSAADDIFQGYGSDSVYTGINQTVNWNDRLFLTLHPEENRKLHFWPQKPEKLRGILDEYSKNLASMIKGIYKAMARSLDLEENCILNSQGNRVPITGRLNMYPRCPCPDRVLGVKPHSDGATMTVLLPDKEVEGLQVQKDDQWYKVPIINGALFINLGDLGEVMTNGVFKSAMHRVVANSLKDRISVAAFFTPEDGNEIEPLSELISEHRPQLYKKFNILEFRRTFFENYALGRRTLDALKI